jgi:prolyl-tRNA editing enzyme YbaK/EbsC (Cys-tRNA(Pro) deacylase)
VDVHNFLLERDAPHEVFAARGRFRSAEQMAAVLDLPSDEVGKVVIFEGVGDQAIAAVVPSGSQPDPRLLGKALESKRIAQATAERASELTDYLAETIPPAGLPSGIRLVLDRSLDRDDVLYFPAGEGHAVLKIRGTDLVRATDASIARIVLEDAGDPGSQRRG